MGIKYEASREWDWEWECCKPFPHLLYREKEETLSAMMAEMNGATPALMKLVWAAVL